MPVNIGVNIQRSPNRINQQLREAGVEGKFPKLLLDFKDEYYLASGGSKTLANAVTHARSTNAVMTDGYGPELVTNGGFDSDLSGWEASGSVTQSNQKAVIADTGGTDGYISQEISTVSGTTYVVEYNLSAVTNRIFLKIGTSENSNNILQEPDTTAGHYSYTFTATGSSTWITFFAYDANQSGAIDNVSVREMPVLKWAPHNLLTYSEAPSSSLTSTNDASWTTNNTLTATAQSGAQTPYARVLQTFTQKGTYVFAVETTSTTVQYLTLQTQIFDANANGISVFDIQSGSVNTEASQHTATITATSEGFLCAIEFELDGTDLNGYLTMGLSEVSGINRIVDPDGTESVTVTRIRSYRSDLGGMVDNPDRGDSYVPTTSSAKQLPRIGHHVYNGSAWVNEGLLAESEARVNIITGNDDLDNGTYWTATALTPTKDSSVAAPDGNSAWKLTNGTSVNFNFMSTVGSIAPTDDNYLTLSCYLKKGNTRYAVLGFGGTKHSACVFDFDTESITDTGSEQMNSPTLTTTVQSVGNGWYRVGFTHLQDGSPNPSRGMTFYPWTSATLPTAVDIHGVTGAGETVYVAFPQAEYYATPSSPIPTTTGQGDRAAETFTIPSANLPWPTPQYIGSELVDSGTFDDASALDDWIASNANLSINNQRLEVENSGSSQGTARQSITTEIGKVYEASFDVVKVPGEGNPIVRLGVSNGGAEYYSVAHSSDATVSFIFTPTTTTTFWTLYTGSSTSGFSAIFDNISVREINPLSVSIAMDGRITFANTWTSGTLQVARFFDWRIDNDNKLLLKVDSTDAAGERLTSTHEVNNVADFATFNDFVYEGVLQSVNVALRVGSTFFQVAANGQTGAENATLTSLVDLSATDLDLIDDYMGTVGTFRVWDKDLGDTGIVEATNPSLEPSLSLDFIGTGTTSFTVSDWSE